MGLLLWISATQFQEALRQHHIFVGRNDIQFIPFDLDIVLDLFNANVCRF